MNNSAQIDVLLPASVFGFTPPANESPSVIISPDSVSLDRASYLTDLKVIKSAQTPVRTSVTYKI